MLELKPSHKPIKEYFAELERITGHGHINEMSVRNAFQDLLQTLSKKVQWQFIEEFAIKRKGRRDASVDGALLDQFSLPRAFWEAKDTKDDLVAEVRNKFESGYPDSNILFWQPGRAILVQGGRQILDADISHPDGLVEVLEAFFNFDLPYIKEWEHAVEEFKEKIPTLAQSVLKILEDQRVKNRAFRDSFDAFMNLAKASINPGLSVEAVEEMLIQHLLTRRIFKSIFKSEGFLQKNAVARELEGVVANLVQGYGTVEDFLRPLDRFYKALEMAAESTDDYAQKQTFLNTVYEKFFQGFAVKVADTHGIVYTPQPIVDFMVRSVQAALETDFNKSLADEGVHILDPFVGTGNFILRVMREIHEKNPRALRHKYLHELHCNEVMLLPYYIACLNIEHLFMELTGEYLPFPGICLVDTFELVEDRQLGMFTNDNTERVQRQKDAPIFVVIGNPPYNAGQVNENDNNKNRKYPAIDKRVAETYAKDSKASNKNALSDPYVKAFRFASDRIIKHGHGLVCMVTNNGFLDGIAFDGMRMHLNKDYNKVLVVDLKGNIRKDSMKDGIPLGEEHTVFGLGAMVGIAVTLCERIHESSQHNVMYWDVHFRAKRVEKFKQLIDAQTLAGLDLAMLVPTSKNVWLTEGMADDWESLIPLGSKEAKSGEGNALFKLFSSGIKTNRDAWVYNFNSDTLLQNVRITLEHYKLQIAMTVVSGRPFPDGEGVDETRISWSESLKANLRRGVTEDLDSDKVRASLYRPFTTQYLYFSRLLNERWYKYGAISPTLDCKNTVIGVPGPGGRLPFWALASDRIMNLSTTSLDATQCFPYSVFDEDGTNCRDNITDWGLHQFQDRYDDKSITKLAVFHYVYGILHDPAYGSKYAANLKRELPRIPFADNFWKVAGIGRRLMDLHVNYEDQPEYPLEEIWTVPKGYRDEYGQEVNTIDQVPLRERYRVAKMKRNKKDPSQLIVNEFLTLTGIPPNVDDYKLGNKSALDWVVDQYQITTDRRTGITNDPNREDDPTYIVNLVRKVLTVSLETVNNVREM